MLYAAMVFNQLVTVIGGALVFVCIFLWLALLSIQQVKHSREIRPVLVWAWFCYLITLTLFVSFMTYHEWWSQPL